MDTPYIYASRQVSGDIKGTILVWDIPESIILSRCVGHKGAVTTVKFDTTKVVSAGVDKTVGTD